MRSMKKILTAILTTVLLANVSGCQTAPPDPAPALQTLTVKSEPASESDRTTVDMSAALEQIIAGINFKPTVSTIKKFVIKDEHDSQTISPHAKQESSYASTSSVEDTDMQGTEPKTIDPTPAPTSEPSAPTPIPAAPTPEPVIEEPSFDISYWIGYAQSYAQGLGLRLESSAVDCWDNPIGAGPHSTCLERDISSRMNRYANDPDITDVVDKSKSKICSV